MRQVPTDIPEVIVERGPQTAFALVRHCFDASTSNSELRRLFQQGAIKVNAQSVKPDALLDIQHGDVIRAGKRAWFRMRVGE